MATAAPDLGKSCLAHYREEKRKNEGGDVVFLLAVELVVMVVWPECH